MDKAEMKILLLGANDRACHSVAKSLHKTGYAVDVVDWKNDNIRYSRYVNRFFRFSDVYLNISKFKLQLFKLLKSERYVAIAPVNDIAVQLLSLFQAELEEEVRICGLNRPATAQYATNKYELLDISEQIGLDIPETLLLQAYDDFKGNSFDSKQFPIIAKPIHSKIIHDNRVYSFEVKSFNNQRKLEDFIRERINIVPVMLQEKVTGYGVGFNFFAIKGEIKAYYFHERLREANGAGESSYRKIKLNVPIDIREKAFALIKAIGWEGIGMLELKACNDAFYVIELNGRFWGSIELGVRAGLDLINCHFNYFLNNEYPEKVLTIKTPFFVRNLKNDFIYVLRTRSLATISKWIFSLYKVFRKNEKIEDNIFNDFIYRSMSWLEIPKIGFRKIFSVYENISARISVKRLKWPNNVTNICFICEGNICRSVFAEKYLNKLKPGINVVSAGLQPQFHKMSPLDAVETAIEFGVDLRSHESKYLGDLDLNTYDVFILMDYSNYIKIRKRFKNLLPKVIMLKNDSEIPDPYGKGKLGFQICYSDIANELSKRFGK